MDVQAPHSRIAGSPVKVAILAGGLGSRLGDLTREIPKPMIEAGGKPFLEHVLGTFMACGLSRFVMLAGYRAEVIREYFGDGSPFGMQIEYSVEDKPLGTGGALREAQALLADRFLVTYGDVYRRFDYDRFVQRHPSSCLAVYPYHGDMTTIDAGNVELDPSASRVLRFEKGAPHLALPFVDAGFALLERETLDLLPASGPCSLESDLYSPLAAAGRIEAEIVDHDFYDIGNPADLARTLAAFRA